MLSLIWKMATIPLRIYLIEGYRQCLDKIVYKYEVFLNIYYNFIKKKNKIKKNKVTE